MTNVSAAVECPVLDSPSWMVAETHGEPIKINPQMMRNAKREKQFIKLGYSLKKHRPSGSIANAPI
jgi:hypothetical protein